MDSKQSQDWLADEVLARFLRYAQIETTSDPQSNRLPSTPGQTKLLKLLRDELSEYQSLSVDLSDQGYLLAKMAGNRSSGATIGFIAHVDTAPDVSGAGVAPLIHDHYNGKPIKLSGDLFIDPEQDPELLRYKGQTVITASGDTLLGADDKAGVAEIMTAIAWFHQHPRFPRGDLEFLFTTDEEIGRGVEGLDFKKIKSGFCYTMDGGKEGEIEAECFNACQAKVVFSGESAHLGKAKNRLVNAATMAACFVGRLPRGESPETTEAREGYYCPHQIKGGIETAEVEVVIRDFEDEGMRLRIKTVKEIGRAVAAAFPGGKVSVTVNQQYKNMRDGIKKRPEGLEYLETACRQAGLEPRRRSVRGGTDGARLTELGLPTPNIFTGGHNFHSRKEWAGLPTMAKAAQVIVYLAKLWSGHSAPDH